MNRKLISIVAILILALLVFTGCGKSASSGGDSGDGGAAEFKYYTAEELKSAIEKNPDDIIMLDIQPEADYGKHHIDGTIATYAFPAKTDEDKAKLDAVLPQLEGSDKDIIIVWPKGKTGAQNTFNYLIEKGIDKGRVYILDGGQAGWSYDDLLGK